MQNPLLNNRIPFYSYIGLWVLTAFFSALLLTYTLQMKFSIALADGLISNLLFGTLGLVLWFPIYYNVSTHEKWINLIVNHIFIGLFSVGLWIGVTYLLLIAVLNTNKAYADFLENSIFIRTGIGVLYYLVIILVYHLFIFNHNYKEKIIQEAELKALVKESELSSLKSQINPHFLFNSLNSISSLTLIEPEKAREMIIKLSDFLRYAISNRDEKLTSLQEELGNINRYLDIEKIRFGKRLVVKQEIDHSCLNLRLPGLILQPIMENAIKYGVNENVNESVIEINGSNNSVALYINISNDCDPDFHSRKGEGVGLKNIRSRLFLLYNQSDLLQIKRTPDKYEVSITFPQITITYGKNESHHH
jgi:two-component system, LytTR family, sensor kinase